MRKLFALFIVFLLLRPAGVHAATAKPSQKPAPAAKVSRPTADDEDDDDEDADERETSVKVPTPPASSTASAPATQSDAEDDDEDDDDEPDPHEVKANIAITSDYLSRGLTLSDHKPALQGGLDWAHPKGFFLGAWASSVTVPDVSSSLALDSFAGFTFPLGRELEETLSVHYTTFFSSDKRANWSFNEETKWRDFSVELAFIPSYRGEGFSYTWTGGWERQWKGGFLLGLFGDYTVYANKGLTTIAEETTVDSEGEEIAVPVKVFEPTPNYADVRLRIGQEFLGALWLAEGVYLKKQTIEGILGEPRVAVSVSKEF